MKLRFFDIARKLAEKSNHNQHKVGCVIVKGNRVIGVGWNQMKTHPASKAYGSWLHAEVHALIGCSIESTQGAEIYVVRVRRCGSLGIAKPCESCAAAIQVAGIKKVHYSNNENSFETESIPR
jgi:deoxycytidylate deaminase